MNCYERATCLKFRGLLLLSGICWRIPNLGQEVQEEAFPLLATSLWFHISLRPDTSVATGPGSQSRIGVERSVVIPLWIEINNNLWLVFHLSFMHLNLYLPKSYTYVLKCLQKSQISPLQLQVPHKTCFLLKKKNSIQKKSILSRSLSHLGLQKIIREAQNISLSKTCPLFQGLLIRQHRQIQ